MWAISSCKIQMYEKFLGVVKAVEAVHIEKIMGRCKMKIKWNYLTLSEKIEALIHPEKYGYKDCPDCKGYGSFTTDVDAPVYELCGVCGGSGIVEDEDEE
jgi:hypothetical protein